MSLNELIAQGAQFKTPDLLGQYATAQNLQQGMQQNALNQMKMDEMRRSLSDQEGMRNYLRSNPNLMDPAVQTQMMAYGKSGQEAVATAAKAHQEKASARSSEATANEKDFTQFTRGARTVNNEEGVAQYVAAMYSHPTLGEMARSIKPFAQSLKENLELFRKNPLEWQTSASSVPFDKVMELYKGTRQNVDTGGATQGQTVDFRGNVVPGSVVVTQKTQTPDSIASNATQQRGQDLVNARAKERLVQETASGDYTQPTIDFLAQTYITTGQLPPMGMGKAAAAARAKVLDRAQQIATGTTPAGAPAGDGPVTSTADAVANVATNRQNIAGQTQTVKDFSTGVGARRVTALNTALNHMDTLEKLGDDLGNNDIRLFNAAAQLFAKQTGAAAPVSFDAAKAVVANEVIKAVVANGGSMAERKEAADTFARANSPEQLKGTLNAYRELLGGQLSTLAQQYETGSGRKDFNKKLSPAAAKLLPATPAAPASSGWGKAEVVK